LISLNKIVSVFLKLPSSKNVNEKIEQENKVMNDEKRKKIKGRLISFKSIQFEDNEVVAGNRDICEPDQELVLASFGSCGCCVLPTVEEVSYHVV